LAVYLPFNAGFSTPNQNLHKDIYKGDAMTAQYLLQQAQTLVIKQRLQWMKEYDRTDNANTVCRTFGISRKTFYKWLNRYEQSNGDTTSLLDRSRTPHTIRKKTTDTVRSLIVQVREATGFGPRRIATELKEKNNIQISPRTIWKVVHHHEMNNKPHPKTKLSLLSNEVPGEVVQLGIKPIKHYMTAFRAVQYSAIDSATRMRCVRMYPAHSTLAALEFVEYLRARFPFPIQCIRTHIDTVFTSVVHPGSATHAFTMNLAKNFIRHSLCNGLPQTHNKKLSRAHSIDEEEFFRRVPCSSFDDLQKNMEQYIHRYNTQRRSAALGNRTPGEFLQFNFPVKVAL
jgi:transposase